MTRLGELERAVMDVLWDRGSPATVRDVADALHRRELAYTTIMTVLDRLTGKGMVERERAGRAWSYRPAATREAYVAQLMLDALDLAGSPESGSRAARGDPRRPGRDAALVRFARSVTGTEAEVLRAALADQDPPNPPNQPGKGRTPTERTDGDPARGKRADGDRPRDDRGDSDRPRGEGS